MPIAVKDVIDTADMPTEYGTPIYKGNQPACDAVCVARAREAGAVVLGKTVSTELANIHPAGTRNPRNLGHTPGGSSSGSAAAVADSHGAARVRHADRRLADPARVLLRHRRLQAHVRLHQHGRRKGAVRLARHGRRVRPHGARRDADRPRADRLRPARLRCEAGAAPRIGLYRTPQWPLAEPSMASAFEGCAGRLARAGATVTEVTAPPLMDDIVLAADAISDYETYGSLTYERARHAELLSPTLTNKLRKAAGVTRERYLAALETASACAQAAR